MTSRLLTKSGLALILASTIATGPLSSVALAAAAPAPVVESGTGSLNGRVVGKITIPGVPGTPAVRSYSWGQQGAVGGAKAVFADLTVALPLDIGASTLMGKAALGTKLTPITLEVYTTGTSTVLATYVISNAYVTYLASSDPGRTGGLPLYQVSFTYNKIQTTIGGTVTCWDLLNNTSC